MGVAEIENAVEEGGRSAEEIAEALERIADGINRLLASGLNERALILLIRDASGVRKDDVRDVLHGLADLRVLYTLEKA